MPRRLDIEIRGGGQALERTFLRPRRVWKFTLPQPTESGRCFIDMPAVVEPRSVGIQNEEIVVWALVDPDSAIATRRFIVANTGMEIPFTVGARFLGTVATDNGIVWHVWDGDAA